MFVGPRMVIQLFVRFTFQVQSEGEVTNTELVEARKPCAWSGGLTV